MSRPFHRLAVATLCFAPTVTMAQSVPVKTLTRPEVEYREPFTSLGGVREVKGGRVVAIDPRDKTVQLIDLKTGTTIKVGREGQGPGEYGFPQGIVPLPGDSSAIADPLNRRLLVISPDGKPGRFIEPPAAAGGGPMMLGMMPRQADERGDFFSTTPGVRMTPEGPRVSDSAAVVRWKAGVQKMDTVAFVALPKGSTQASGGGGQMRMTIGGGNPFNPRDEWAVAPDGRVAVVRAADYHVDWITPDGQRHVGTPIRYDRVRVSDKHKEEWRESRKNTVGMMVQSTNGRTTARAVAGGRDLPEPTDWPEYLPPFLANAAIVAPDGMLWVLRTAEAGTAPTYDVIDGSGRLVQRVVLPKRSRLVGFGAGVAYVVRIDDDDLEYLQRYRL